MKYKYLEDSAFLKTVDELKIKNRFAKIILLDWNENPIQQIEGIVTGGSLNIDGSSAMRRTGSLSLVSDNFENDVTNIRNPFSINKKIKIEIGVENYTDKYTEEKIIWYPLGIFVITGCNLQRDINQLNISLQFKDKMCLLDGSCGGILPASIIFNEYMMYDDNRELIVQHPTIYRIILELVNHYGGEQLRNIIISDLDERIQKIVKWVGEDTLYIFKQGEDYQCTTDSSKFDEEYLYGTYEYGEDIGYEYTDFIYTEDLVNNAGESITSVLDKIIQYLGNYEYFYDIEGNFIFQEKKNFLNVSQSTAELNTLNMNNNVYLLDMGKTKSCYSFVESNLITSYSNTPQYEMIKNDFVVWGEKPTADGRTVPIRYHLAIDSKPDFHNEYEIFIYTDPNDDLKKAKVARRFEELPTEGSPDIFYQYEDKVYVWQNDGYEELDVELQTIISNDWRTELYLQGTENERFGTDGNYYFTELENEWLKLYDIENNQFYEDVIKNPTGIDYFLDFIDSNASISEFEISNIGRRTKVLVDDKINCIFEPEIPNLAFINIDDENIENLKKECVEHEVPYTQVSNDMYQLIYGGGNHNSAVAAVRDLLYQHTSYNETITLQALPIFYLEPNTRITVDDPATNIFGDYIINSISLSFDVQGIMTINAVRALERF